MQAAATRADILASARRLFAQHGFAGTPIADIAAAAGVAVQTVYKVFASKEGILLGLLDTFEAEARRLSDVVDFTTPTDPREQIRAVVAFHRQLFETSHDLLDVFRSAGAAQGELAVLWTEGGRRRRQGQAAVVRQWHRKGYLRKGLGLGAGADQLWAMTSPDLYSLLVVQSGWTPDAYETWLNQTLAGMLFTTPAAEQRR
jgi:AcrR family transcriptional regulator